MKEKLMSKNTRTAIIIVLILALALIVAGYFFLLNETEFFDDELDKYIKDLEKKNKDSNQNLKIS